MWTTFYFPLAGITVIIIKETGRFQVSIFMSLQDIKNYVVNCLKEGFDRPAIMEAASKAGWPESEMEKVFDDEEVKAVFAKIEESKRLAPKEISAEIIPEEKESISKAEESTPKEQKTRPSSEDTFQRESRSSDRVEAESEDGVQEVSSQLKEYVMENLEKGFDPSVMRNTLIEAGWPEDVVDKVFKDEDIKKFVLDLREGVFSAGDDRLSENEDRLRNTRSQKKSKSFVVPFAHRPNSELKNYVINEMKKGSSKLSIKAAAIEVGWPEKEVDNVLEEEDIKREALTAKEKPRSPSKEKTSKKEVVDDDDFLDEFINPAGYKSQRFIKKSDGFDHEEAPDNPFFSIFANTSESTVEEEEDYDEEVSQGGGSQEEEQVVAQEEVREEKVVRDPYLELRNYIINEMKRGISRLAIKTAAVDAGWPSGEIDKIFNEKELKDLSPRSFN